MVDRFAEESDVAPSRAVTPLGAPETDSVMVCEVPDNVEVVSVEEALPPAVTVPEVGERAIPKSLTTGAFTFKE